MKTLCQKLQEPTILLSILLIAFFFKGVFLVALFPMFTGQDEARHYNTIQYLNEPTEKPTPEDNRKTTVGNDSFSGYNFSEEILRAGEASDIDRIRKGLFETIDFAQGTNIGKNEATIEKQAWRPINFFLHPDIVGGKSLYHQIGARIEHALEDSSILVRFYALRIFSVLLGTLAVLFAYLIAKNAGFDTRASILIAALVSFQPKFSQYFTNINYDTLLIPIFFLFTLGGVLSIKDGPNVKNILIMAIAIILGLLTKGTAIVMLPVFIALVAFHLFTRITIKNPKKLLFSIFIILGAIIFITLLFREKYSFHHIIPSAGSPIETIQSLGKYLEKSKGTNLTTRTYWGALDWNDGFLSNYSIDIIRTIEYISAIGLLVFLFARRTPSFLPNKRQVLFCIGILLALQLGIRIADWISFIQIGYIGFGTPGRYFLPNLAIHIIVVAVGIGMLAGTRRRLHNALAIFTLGLFFFSLALTINSIVPRFYL